MATKPAIANPELLSSVEQSVLPSQSKSLIDDGFNDEKFDGEEKSIPIAQFINPVRSDNWGIGIKVDYAEMAEFKPDQHWQKVNHKFDGAKEKVELWLCQKPRIIVLNQSQILMSDGENLRAFNKDERTSDHKVFSYWVVFFLGENNRPLSIKPFRLKVGGQSGMSLTKAFFHTQSPSNFKIDFSKAYKHLTGDKKPKGDFFYAHAVFVPNLVEGVATNKEGKSSPACLCEGYIIPTADNYLSLRIPRKINEQINPDSIAIEEAIEYTKEWVAVKTVNQELQSIKGDGESDPLEARSMILGEIKDLAGSLEWNNDRIRSEIQDAYNVSGSKELSLEQLMSFRDFMDGLLKHKQPELGVNEVAVDDIPF